MNIETLDNYEKLEKIEVEALENTDEVVPLERNNESVEIFDSNVEADIEMSSCSCKGGCGSNYSHGECYCSGSCGSNYHK